MFTGVGRTRCSIRGRRLMEQESPITLGLEDGRRAVPSMVHMVPQALLRGTTRLLDDTVARRVCRDGTADAQLQVPTIRGQEAMLRLRKCTTLIRSGGPQWRHVTDRRYRRGTSRLRMVRLLDT